MDLIKLYNDFQETNPNYRKYNLGQKDIFIQMLGYACYEYNNYGITVSIPDYTINRKEITLKQKQFIYALLESNNLKATIVCDNQIQNDLKCLIR